MFDKRRKKHLKRLTKMQPIQTIRLILGDQLNAKHSWFQTKDDSILYVIAELKQETNYVKHHVQKICAFFLGQMRFFMGHQFGLTWRAKIRAASFLTFILLRHPHKRS